MIGVAGQKATSLLTLINVGVWWFGMIKFWGFLTGDGGYEGFIFPWERREIH